MGVGRLDNLLYHMWTWYPHQISNVMSRTILRRDELQWQWDRDRNMSKYACLRTVIPRGFSSWSLQLKEFGQLGVHGVHAQQHVILVLGLEQEAIQAVSHVVAAHLIPEIVSVSFSELWI